MADQQSGMTTASFLRDYGGHLLAALALLQVWAIALWRRFVSRGVVNVYPTAGIEIGFSSFGPTVGLLGTLRAERRDVFIKRMRVRVVRLRDRAEHNFNWKAFRPNVIPLVPTAPQTFAIASSFLVAAQAPRQYNVFFASETFAGDYQAQVQPLRDAWQAFVEQRFRQIDEKLTGQVARVVENPTIAAALFGEFIREGHATSLHAALMHGFFWNAGDYDIEFIVETHGLAKQARCQWRFTLTKKDEDDLRLNAITILRELCYMPAVYNFAHKEYPSS